MKRMDREKVIERIHEAIDMGVCVDLFMDVLELLKEQKKALYELGQLLKEQAEEIERLKKSTVGDNKIPLKW